MMPSNNSPSTNKGQPMLRSVSMVAHSRFQMIQPALRRRCASNEPALLVKALEVNSANFAVPSPNPEESLKEFLRWSHEQTLPLLPHVTEPAFLMPTRITLCQVPVETITSTIASCLQEFQRKRVLFSYHPHPDHAGRIEICSLRCKLKFVIQLWRTDSSGEVVVELQRRRGCPVFMHHVRRSLFKALRDFATGEEPTHVQPAITKGETSATTAAKAFPSHAISLPLLNFRCERPYAFPPPLKDWFYK